MPDSNARRHLDFKPRCFVPLPHHQRPSRHIRSVLRSGNGERSRQVSRSGSQLVDGSSFRTPPPHQINSNHRLSRPDEHTSRLALRLGYQIQAFVHAVNEVDVRMAGWSEDDAGAIRNAASRVRGQIVTSKISLGFDDHPSRASVYQDLSEQFARNFDGVAIVKRARQYAALRCQLAPFHCTIIIAQMRLFTGIDLPPDVIANLEELLLRLKPSAQISWSPPRNLHVTTKFIGEWLEERLAELKAALGTVAARAPIPVSIEKLGYFPNPHSPRVFWAGISGGDELAGLASDTETALVPLGIAKEERAYSPHLTLARIKTPGKQPALLQAVAKLTSLQFGSFIADRFYLYHSRTAPSGSVYTKLAEFPLAK